MASDSQSPELTRRYQLPPVGGNPSSRNGGTTPGSFANRGQIGGPLSFSSPDTPGMPSPSKQTAWDFMPANWKRDGDRWIAPDGFVAVTQLDENAGPEEAHQVYLALEAGEEKTAAE